MRYKEFAGKKASQIVLGTVNFGVDLSESQSFEFMDTYIQGGGNFLDTARVYGDFDHDIPGISEEVIGRWLSARHCRDKVLLSTKGAHPRLGHMHQGRLSRECVMSDISESLDALQTGCVDIYFLHRDDTSLPVEEILETTNLLLEKGYANTIGVSNWVPSRIIEANRYASAHGLAGFYANQPQFSLVPQVHVEDDTLVQLDHDMYSMHISSNMPCMCYSSQAKGFCIKLQQSGGNVDKISPKLREQFISPENMEIYRRVLNLSEETDISVGSLSIAYLTCQPFPTFPIVGASSINQLRESLAASDAVISPEQSDFLRKI